MKNFFVGLWSKIDWLFPGTLMHKTKLMKLNLLCTVVFVGLLVAAAVFNQSVAPLVLVVVYGMWWLVLGGWKCIRHRDLSEVRHHTGAHTFMLLWLSTVFGGLYGMIAIPFQILMVIVVANTMNILADIDLSGEKNVNIYVESDDDSVDEELDKEPEVQEVPAPETPVAPDQK